MKKQQKIIVDTSIFVNPDSRCVFGATPDEALSSFLLRLRQNPALRCYMPPSAWEELSIFLKNIPAPAESILIKKQPPSSYQEPVPALFVYEIIEEMRMRINKGLRIAEKYTRRGANNREQDTIKKLRTEFRGALREGIIDSKADFDLILLAKEIKAYLATSDNGLAKWARKLGIPCLEAQELHALLASGVSA